MRKPVQWYVYALKDPVSDEVRYIGWTCNTEKRLRTHISSGRCHTPRTHRACWIKSLLTRGLRPLMEVLDSGFGDPAPAEIAWIAKMRQAGVCLTNATDGGDGAAGYRFSKEGLHNLSVSHRGYVMPPDQRERISASLRRLPMPPERLAALRESAARARRNITTKSLRKMGESKLGKTLSAAHRDKIRKANTNRGALPQAWRQAMCAGARRRCSTPEGLAQARRAMAHARRADWEDRHKDQLCLTLSL